MEPKTQPPPPPSSSSSSSSAAAADLTASSSSKQQPLCEECKTKPSKYKCPGCSLRSCSLPCVKSHKLRTSCTGKKQYNDVVPLSKFDDNLIISDYNMLEDAKRVAESAHRMRLKLCGYSHFRLPFPLKSLRSAAASRRTKLLFLPSGMLKREANRTYYNNRKKFISWTIEWRFHSTDVVLIDHGVHENTSLCSVIENHFKPGPWNHKLKQFCKEPLDALKFFIRKYPKGPKSPFRELDINAPVREQLANLGILEYPVIHVFLPSDTYDFEVIRDAVPRKIEHKEPVNDGSLSPQGVIFREEEIEDAGALDTHVSDLLNHANEERGYEKELNQPSDSALLAERAQGTQPIAENETFVVKAEDNNIYIGSNTNELAVEDMDFDFDQGLIDAYSHIVAETNPDDFFDFEGIFSKEKHPEGREEHADFSGIFPIEEELEEGEIV